MKKALHLTTLLFLVVSVSQAQITKGSVLLGGNIGFSNTDNISNTVARQNNVYVDPTIGIAVKTNYVAVISIYYSYGKYISDTINTLRQHIGTVGGGLFLRRYFPVAKSFYLYVQGDLNYLQSHDKTEYTGYRQKFDNSTVSLDIVPGIAYAVSKKFHLELGLNNLLAIQYGVSKTETTDANGTRTINGNGLTFNTSLSNAAPIYLGFRVFLSKKA